MRETIPHAVFEAARKSATALAIRGEDGVAVPYQELEELVRNCAAAFIARGIQAGDRVAIWAPNSARWVIAALGIQAARAILVTLNTRLKGPEANYILGKTDARLLLTMSEFLGVDYPAMIAKDWPENLEEIILMDGELGGTSWHTFIAGGMRIDSGQVDDRLAALGERDISDILFTSGTTGRPKGVASNHGQNIRLYRRYSATLELGPGDSSLIVIPFFHSFGYKAGWLTTLMSGATLLPHATFDAVAILERIAREKATYMPGPPTLYQSLLAAPYRNYDLSSLRIATTGGAPVPVSLVSDMRTALGIDTVITAYGLSESCGTVSMCDADDDDETVARTAGRPLPGTEVRLVDEHAKDVPVGMPGEVLVRGDCVMVGYFDDTEATRVAVDPEGWLHTGDIGVQDLRGYLSITDRKKDMVIVGGFNVYPAEVERMMRDHPSILHAAVIGIPHERLGEVPKAFVVLRPGTSATAESIVAWCRDHMANFKVPRSVEMVPALPVNASGKVQKFMLRDGGTVPA